MATNEAVTFAVGTLTAAGVFTDTQTVVIAGKTYTTQTVLTNVDGNVLIGANAAATLQNLYDAINLTGTAGTQYAAAMTENTSVEATAVTATTLVVKAKIPGAIGNNIATTETQTNASWGAATLASGTGDIGKWVEDLIRMNQINSEVYHDLIRITPAGV
jgi:predicted carbohydrate-binding protein with CBM5 and CBM33 domain